MALLTTGSGDGSLRVEVDAFGAFGSAVGSAESSNAFYDPIGELAEAGTTYESGIAFRLGDEGERTFLSTGSIGGSGLLTEFDLGTTTDTSVASTFNYEGLDFALTQEVANLFSDEGEISGSNLTQTYTITNPGSEAVEFEIIRYIDGDLQFDDSISDAGGRLIRNGQEILFETDSGDNPDFATTFFGITATGGATEQPGRFEIDSYSGLRSGIIAGEALDDTVNGDGPDADEFVDSEPYDLALALDNSFILNPGETRTYTTTTIFGSGAPEEFTPPSSGFVIDNYIAGATVFFDANQNGILDENEPNTITDDSGAYELNIPNSFDSNNNGLFDIEEGVIVASGGTDTATGLPLETPVTALADSEVITLLTSLVTNLVNQGLSVEEANNQVTTALSIPSEIDILNLDPIVATNNNQPGGVETFAAMVKTQNLITQTAALLAGATNSSISEITDEVVAAITSEIQSSGNLNLTDTEQLESIIEAAATNANADVSEIKDEVALVIAEANQQIDNAVANSSTDSLEEEFANVQKVSLDKTTSDLQQVGAGNKSIEDVVAENTGEALDDLIAGTDTPFTAFDPADDSLNLINAIVTDDNLTIHSDGDFSPTFTGSQDQTSFYDGSLTDLGIGAGILLTSGDGNPPLTNTSGSYSVSLGGVGDADLDAVATDAFPGAGATQDANVLEFSFDITDPNVKSVTFDIVFGSDEFPEFSNSNFVDVAGVFVNGENYAYFNNDLTQPLSIIDNNLQLGNFTDNTTGILPIEYDGVSDVLKILAPVQEGKNTIKFGVADTGDQAYDSGLFVANLQTSTLGDGNNSGLFVNITGSDGDDELNGSEINEFIDALGGNDTINPGLGNDFVDAGAGDDTIFGGQGDNEIDGGDGVDTVVYSGNQNEFNIEKIGDVIKVGNNTDTLTNVEFLSFDDATISTTDIQPEEENFIFTTDIDGTTVEAIDLTGFATEQVTVDFTISREADFENQVYFYAVDDITGTVGGVAVGEDGYMEAALNSLVSPVFSTSDDNTETGSLEFDAGSIVVPVIIADGNLTEALSGEAEIYFPYLGANSDDGNFDHIKLLDDNTFGFEDLPNGGDQDFNDITIEINSIA